VTQLAVGLLAVCLASPLAAQVDIPTTPRDRDYYAWITSIATAPHQLITPRTDTANSRRYRMVVLTSEIYSTVIVEEVRYGSEGCCARVVAARQVNLDSLARHFQMKGELAGFTVLSSPAPTIFRVRFKGRDFEVSRIDQPNVRFTEIRP